MKQSKIDTRYLPLAAMILRMMEEDGIIKKKEMKRRHKQAVDNWLMGNPAQTH